MTEEEGENYITFKYQQNLSLTDIQMENLNIEIVNDLFDVFGYDSEDIQQSNYVVGNQRIDVTRKNKHLLILLV